MMEPESKSLRECPFNAGDFVTNGEVFARITPSTVMASPRDGVSYAARWLDEYGRIVSCNFWPDWEKVKK